MAGEWVSVMCIDPGVTTGVARGVFDLARGSVRECLGGSALDCESFDVCGDEREQGLALAIEWTDWVFSCNVEHGLALDAMWLCVEDWQPRLPLKSGSREVFYPVRIASALEGALGLGVTAAWPVNGVVYQQPADAKRRATDERLRSWGRWVKGRDHQRDAWRHVALRLSVLLG